MTPPVFRRFFLYDEFRWIPSVSFSAYCLFSNGNIFCKKWNKEHKKKNWKQQIRFNESSFKGHAKQKSAFESEQIHIILRMRKVSSGPLLSIDNFYSIQWVWQRSAKVWVFAAHACPKAHFRGSYAVMDSVTLPMPCSGDLSRSLIPCNWKDRNALKGTRKYNTLMKYEESAAATWIETQVEAMSNMPCKQRSFWNKEHI